MTNHADFALITVTQDGDVEVYVQSPEVYRQFGKHKVKVTPTTIHLSAAQVKLLVNPPVRSEDNAEETQPNSH